MFATIDLNNSKAVSSYSILECISIYLRCLENLKELAIAIPPSSEILELAIIKVFNDLFCISP